MARVLMPTMARRYNPNPRGSSTTTVTMRSHNPFESRVSLLNGMGGGALPGMSGLGDNNDAEAMATTPTPAAPAASAGAFDWTALAQSLATAGVQVGGQLATNRVNQLYGPAAKPLTAAGAVKLPVGTPLSQPSTILPWAIAGGGVVLAGILLFAFRGKKSSKKR